MTTHIHRRDLLKSLAATIAALSTGEPTYAGPLRAQRRKRIHCPLTPCCDVPNVRPTFGSTDGDRQGWYYRIDISDRQKWRLVDMDGNAIAIPLGYRVSLTVLHNFTFNGETYDTQYCVTGGLGNVVGTRAWLGYGVHHPDNQFSFVFDGALYFSFPGGGTAYSNEGTNPVQFVSGFGDHDDCYGQIHANINETGVQEVITGYCRSSLLTYNRAF